MLILFNMIFPNVIGNNHNDIIIIHNIYCNQYFIRELKVLIFISDMKSIVFILVF